MIFQYKCFKALKLCLQRDALRHQSRPIHSNRDPAGGDVSGLGHRRWQRYPGANRAKPARSSGLDMSGEWQRHFELSHLQFVDICCICMHLQCLQVAVQLVTMCDICPCARFDMNDFAMLNACRLSIEDAVIHNDLHCLTVCCMRVHCFGSKGSNQLDTVAVALSPALPKVIQSLTW